MSSSTPGTPSTSALTERELEALVSGAAWYARYHQRDIDPEHEDPSAAAAARREHFTDLFSALDKLGVRMRRPPALGGRPTPQ